MPDKEWTRNELHRRFEAIIVDSGLWDPPTRPEQRHLRLPEPRVYQLRVVLEQVTPPIWRRIHVRSDLTLAALHLIIQTAFEWGQGHPYRFSIGGRPTEPESQIFVSPPDSEWAFDGGTPPPETPDVGIDEALQERDDRMHYIYDDADSPTMAITLEKLLPIEYVIDHVLAIDGDPGTFDADHVNLLLDEAFRVEEDISRVPIRLVELGMFMELGAQALQHGERIGALIDDDRVLEPEAFAQVIGGIQWFLERAAGDGFLLTAAGYLKPKDVLEASRAVPRVWLGYGKNNRESGMPEVLGLREGLQDIGLLRKFKGRLKLTRAGATAAADPEGLRQQFVERMIPHRAGFEQDATLLYLLHAATSHGEGVDAAELAGLLTQIGYSDGSGGPVTSAHIIWLPVQGILGHVTEDTDVRLKDRLHVSEEASMLAREILLGSGLGPAME